MNIYLYSIKKDLKGEIYIKKSEFIKIFAKKYNVSQAETKDWLNAFLETIEEKLLNGESIVFAGFGTFKVVEHKEKTYRDINDGQLKTTKPTKFIKFIPAERIFETIKSK